MLACLLVITPLMVTGFTQVKVCLYGFLKNFLALLTPESPIKYLYSIISFKCKLKSSTSNSTKQILNSVYCVSDLPWIVIFWIYTCCVTFTFSVMQKKTPAYISSQSLMQDLDPKRFNCKKVIRGLIQTQQDFWFYCVLVFKDYCDNFHSISKFFS